MSAFEVEGNPPYDEHLVANENFVDNPLYSPDPLSTGAKPPSSEQLLPPVQPLIPTAPTDRSGQYINLFAQPPFQNR